MKQRTSGKERRAEELYITPKGHAEAQTVRQIVRQQSEAFFAETPKQDRDHLFRILRTLYRQVRNLPCDTAAATKDRKVTKGSSNQP